MRGILLSFLLIWALPASGQITQTYTDYAITAGNVISNRPVGAYLRYICTTEADLPTTNVIDGDRAFTEDTDRRWLRSGGAWVLQTVDVIAAFLVTTSQQAALPIGAVTDGQFLKRVGGDIVGAAGGGADWPDITNKPAPVTALLGTNTGDQTTVSGNAGTATILQTARDINGISFNGSANITIPAYATIQEEGSGVTQRPILNFVGGSITCVDDTTRTTCTITGGGGGLDHAQVMSRVSLRF